MTILQAVSFGSQMGDLSLEGEGVTQLVWLWSQVTEFALPTSPGPLFPLPIIPVTLKGKIQAPQSYRCYGGWTARSVIDVVRFCSVGHMDIPILWIKVYLHIWDNFLCLYIFCFWGGELKLHNSLYPLKRSKNNGMVTMWMKGSMQLYRSMFQVPLMVSLYHVTIRPESLLLIVKVSLSDI